MNPNHNNRPRTAPRPSRRGLAPLELVLWLPVLLFVAALMVNLGTMTVWRMRGEIVSRDAAWRERWPRSGQGEPRPKKNVWPDPATIDVAVDDQIGRGQELAVFEEVMRGRLPAIPWQQHEILDPDRGGAYRGTAEIERAYPALSKLGRFESGEIAHPMLDRMWQASQMRLESANGRRSSMPNVYRRIKALYDLPKTDPGLPQAFTRSVTDLVNSQEYETVQVIDNDEQARALTGSSPDFHPRINSGRCELDVDLVRRIEVVRLIGGIDAQGLPRISEIGSVPGRMESYFRQLKELAAQRGR